MISGVIAFFFSPWFAIVVGVLLALMTITALKDEYGIYRTVLSLVGIVLAAFACASAVFLPFFLGTLAARIAAGSFVYGFTVDLLDRK